jgi:hypothetical protein
VIGAFRSGYVCETHPPRAVMAGHSRPKDGVASLAYVPAIHVFLASDSIKQDMDARHKAGHDEFRKILVL